jgi:hypothetical protein
MYVIDRETGEVLSADAFAHVTAYDGVDLETGRIRPVAAKKPREGRVVRGICPAAPGGKEWNPSAFSPRTGLLYVPHLNLCMDHGLSEANYIEGTPFLGAESKFYAGPGGNRGVFTAWDPIGRKPVWRVNEDLPLWSGALVTAGDVQRERALLALRVARLAADLPAHLLAAEVVVKRASALMELWPWAGLIGAGLAWALSHQIGSDGVFFDCGGTGLTLVVGVVALVLAAVSGLGSFRLWRRGGETEARRFVALIGWLSALLLGLAIVLSTVAGLILPECLS